MYTNGGITYNPFTGNLNVGGNLNVIGNLVVDNTYINNIFLTTTDTVIITNSNATTSSTSGALQVLGGVGVGGNLFVAGSAWHNNLTVFSNNAATSTTSGALIVNGGIGVAGNLVIGSNITLSSSGGQNVTATGTSLTLQQTGDSFGTTGLTFENRVGLNGALFFNAGADLVDFGYRSSSGAQYNTRFEHRSSSLANSNNTRGEYQIIDILGAGNRQFPAVFGQSAILFSVPAFAGGAANSALVGINTLTPTSQLDVNGNMSIGSYAGVTAGPTNGVIISGNVGIGTSTVNSGNTLAVYGGNAFINNNVVASAFQPFGSVIPPNGMYLTATNTLGWATNSAERMVLDSYGNLSVNTTSVSQASAGITSFTVNGSTGAIMGLYTGGSTSKGYLYTNGSQLYLISDSTGGPLQLQVSSSNPMLFYTNNTESMRLTSTGQLLLGITSLPAGPAVWQVINNPIGGGTEWVFNNSGGGNVSALSGGGLAFSTFTGAVGSEAYIQSVLINSSGNVGIGTSTINAGNALAVYGGNIIVAGILQVSNTATQLGGIQFADGTFMGTAATGGGGGGSCISVVNDITTNAPRYITFTGATSGTISTINTSSTELVYYPVNGNLVIGGNLTVSNAVGISTFAGNVGIGTTVATTGYLLSVNGGIAATTKSFVINHPTKSGMKLQYASLEGPENGVYIRGKLEGTNRIMLPDYWSKLVDQNSISVHLTPIGKHQKLYVVEITPEYIEIASDTVFFTPLIACFYTVYAERADVPKLLVEV